VRLRPPVTSPLLRRSLWVGSRFLYPLNLLSALRRELAWLLHRYRQLRRLMRASAAVKVLVRRRASTIAVRLKAAPAVCTLRPQSTDVACLEKVFFHEEYRLPFSVKPQVIIDAGANIGSASIYFATRFPDARVLALEPEASNFELLKKNCSPFLRVTPLQAALWSECEPLALVDPRSSKWAFAVQRPFQDSGTIPGITVDALMRQFGFSWIDVLKLDIEGAEQEIFSRGPIGWLRRVSVIAIELHDRLRPGCSQAFYSAIHGLQFTQEVRGENVFIQIQN